MSRDISKADTVLQELWPLLKAKYEERHPGRYLFLINVDRKPSEQLALFCQGRLPDKPGPIVTYKDGYNNLSKHNADPSQAFDFGVMDGSKVVWPESYFEDIGDMITMLDYGDEITWGGTFRSLKDCGHIEVH